MITELPETSDPGPESESEWSDADLSSDSESDLDESSTSESEEEVTKEYLQLLLQRARESAAAVEPGQFQTIGDNEEVLTLDDVEQPYVP